MNEEKANARDAVGVSVLMGQGVSEGAFAHGRFDVECVDIDGNVIWRDTAENVVTTVGKNLALDTYLAGAAYTVVGPFLGLISLTSFSAVAAGDTMASHAGWLEAGNANTPAYTAPRKTAAWNAASAGSKALTFSAPGIRLRS